MFQASYDTSWLAGLQPVKWLLSETKLDDYENHWESKHDLNSMTLQNVTGHYPQVLMIDKNEPIHIHNQYIPIEPVSSKKFINNILPKLLNSHPASVCIDIIIHHSCLLLNSTVRRVMITYPLVNSNTNTRKIILINIKLLGLLWYVFVATYPWTTYSGHILQTPCWGYSPLFGNLAGKLMVDETCHKIQNEP
jgi:hypothetical protein